MSWLRGILRGVGVAAVGLACVSAVHGKPPEGSLRKGLQAFWDFDEGQGVTAIDAINRNNLLLLATRWLKGVEGDALSFDGQQAFAELPDSQLKGAFPCQAQNGATSFTFAAWVRLYQDRQRNPIVVKHGNFSHGVMLLIDSGGQLGVDLFAAPGKKTSLRSSRPVTPRQWHHIAATYAYQEQGGSTLILYIDGKESRKTELAVGPPMPNDTPLSIGRFVWNDVHSRYFSGRIDDLAIYDRALTATEVKALAEPK